MKDLTHLIRDEMVFVSYYGPISHTCGPVRAPHWLVSEEPFVCPYCGKYVTETGPGLKSMVFQ